MKQFNTPLTAYFDMTHVGIRSCPSFCCHSSTRYNKSMKAELAVAVLMLPGQQRSWNIFKYLAGSSLTELWRESKAWNSKYTYEYQHSWLWLLHLYGDIRYFLLFLTITIYQFRWQTTFQKLNLKYSSKLLTWK